MTFSTLTTARSSGLIPRGDSLIKERELVIPALIVLNARKNDFVPMRTLIDELTTIVKPVKFNSDILPNRKDSRFSQLVRNMKSHKTLTTKGWVEETTIDRQCAWRITEKGVVCLEEKLHH